MSDPRGAHAHVIEPLVTLIMPMLDPSPLLLRRALSSATAQSYSNLEILVVDDGSSPANARLIDALAVGDPRIRVFHQENAGVSAARNLALSLARGEFVGFVDADDYLCEGYVSAALSVMSETRADVVFGQMILRSRGIDVIWRTVDCELGAVVPLGPAAVREARAKIFSASPSFDDDFPAITFPNVVGALYAASVVKDIEFPVGVKHGEDRVFNFFALERAKRVVVVNAIWYTYDRTHEGGVTQRFSASRIPDLAPTIASFAHACGLNSPDSSRSISTDERTGAVLGIFAYLKLAIVASGEAEGLTAVPAIADLLRLVADEDALRFLPPDLKLADRIVKALARQQCAFSLVLVTKCRRLLRHLRFQSPFGQERR